MIRQRQGARRRFLCVVTALLFFSGGTAADQPDHSSRSHPGAGPRQIPPAPEVVRLPPVGPSAHRQVDPVDEPAAVESAGNPVVSQSAPAKGYSAERLASEIAPQDELFPTLAGSPNYPQVPVQPAHGHPPGPEQLASNYPPTDISPEQVVLPPAADSLAAEPVKVSWEEPESLLAQLRELTAEAAAHDWAAEVCRLVERLGPAVGSGSEQTESILRRLDELASEATPLAATLNQRVQMRKLLRAACALKRRLGVWRHVVQYGIPPAAGIEDAPQSSQRLALVLSEIDAVTAGSTEGKAWREFLLIDALRELSPEKSAGRPGRVVAGLAAGKFGPPRPAAIVANRADFRPARIRRQQTRHGAAKRTAAPGNYSRRSGRAADARRTLRTHSLGEQCQATGRGPPRLELVSG